MRAQIILEDYDEGWLAYAICWHGPRFGGSICSERIAGIASEDMNAALDTFQRDMMKHLVNFHSGVSDPNAERRIQALKIAARQSNNRQAKTGA